MSTTRPTRPAVPPPLLDGQRLDRAEFHRRYEAMPPGTRAELVGGVVVMPSPVSYEHDRTNILIHAWLGRYEDATPGVEALGHATWILDDLAEPQPDAVLRILPGRGRSSRSEGRYLAGAPELVVEVSLSSRPIDLGPKREDYRRTGVREYLVVGLEPFEIVWHARRGDQFVPLTTAADGLWRSEAFPGLWLDPTALRALDRPGMLAGLARGLATPEHAAFAGRLAEAGPGR